MNKFYFIIIIAILLYSCSNNDELILTNKTECKECLVSLTEAKSIEVKHELTLIPTRASNPKYNDNKKMTYNIKL